MKFYIDWESAKAGLWTLVWTMDWTVDWTVDWAMDWTNTMIGCAHAEKRNGFENDAVEQKLCA